MEEEPKIEDVLKNIYDLYGNPDVSKKEGASKYLATLQDSVRTTAKSCCSMKIEGFH